MHTRACRRARTHETCSRSASLLCHRCDCSCARVPLLFACTWAVHQVERRDAGNPLQSRDNDIAIGLSCTAFQDPQWVARNRPEWPKNLADQVARYAAEVKQPVIPLPPKGAPPTRGELEF